MTEALATPAQVTYLRTAAKHAPISRAERSKFLRLAGSSPTREEFGEAIARIRAARQAARGISSSTPAPVDTPAGPSDPYEPWPGPPEDLDVPARLGTPVIRTPAEGAAMTRTHEMAKREAERTKAAARKPPRRPRRPTDTGYTPRQHRCPTCEQTSNASVCTTPGCLAAAAAKRTPPRTWQKSFATIRRLTDPTVATAAPATNAAA